MTQISQMTNSSLSRFGDCAYGKWETTFGAAVQKICVICEICGNHIAQKSDEVRKRVLFAFVKCFVKYPNKETQRSMEYTIRMYPCFVTFDTSPHVVTACKKRPSTTQT